MFSIYLFGIIEGRKHREESSIIQCMESKIIMEIIT